jgi:tetratricopeptide (TPR) repeat protein
MPEERNSKSPKHHRDPTPEEPSEAATSPGDIYSGRESHRKSLGRLTSRERIARSRKVAETSETGAPTVEEPVDHYSRDDHRSESVQDAESRHSARQERRKARKRRKRNQAALQLAGIVLPVAVIALLIGLNVVRSRREVESVLTRPAVSPESERPAEDAEPARRTSVAEDEAQRISRLRRAKEFELDAWRFIHAGDPESALAKVDIALERCPELISLHFTRGKVLFDLGRFDEAVVDLRRAVEGDPSASAYFAALGACYLKLDDPEAAAVCLETAVSLDPELPETLSQLGYTWLQLGYEDRALSALERAASLKPGDAAVLANLAEAQLLRGRAEEAIATARNSLDLDPGGPVALYALARAYARIGSADNTVATLTLAYDRLGAQSVARWLGAHDFGPLRGEPGFQQFSRWIAAESFRDEDSSGTGTITDVTSQKAASDDRLQLRAPAEITPEPELQLHDSDTTESRSNW